MGKSEHQHNLNDHWCTPAEVYDPIVEHWGGIGLDPFSNPDSQIPADNKWSELSRPKKGYRGTAWGIDSFEHAWSGWGLVFLNGPFSQAEAWLKKGLEEADELIFLCKANMNARYLHRWVRPLVDTLAFWDHRMQFLGAPWTASFHVMLGYRGPNPDRFENAFADRAWVMHQGKNDNRPRTRKLRVV